MKLLQKLMENTETLDLFANDKNKIQNMQLHVRQLQNNLIDKYSQYGLKLKLSTIDNKLINIEYIYTNYKFTFEYRRQYELDQNSKKNLNETIEVISSIIRELMDFSKEYRVALLWKEMPFNIYALSKTKDSDEINQIYHHLSIYRAIKKLKFVDVNSTRIPALFDYNFVDVYVKIPVGFYSDLFKQPNFIYKGQLGKLDYNLDRDPEYRNIIHNIKSPISLEKIRKQLPWPNIVKEFVANNLGITTAEGSPVIVNGFCSYYNNHISSFEGFPKVIKGSLDISKNDFISLKNIHYYIHQIDGEVSINNNITSHIMGLMKIKGLTKITPDRRSNNEKLNQAVEIMNHHLGGRGNFFDCLEELEDAGLEEFAQL